MSYKNTLLFTLMIAVLGSAFISILYVVDAVSKDQMMEFFTKGGLILLILAAAMVLVSAVRGMSQK